MPMFKKNFFIIALLIIYLLFLCKDTLWGFIDNTEALTNVTYEGKIKYYQEEYKNMQDLLKIDHYDYDIIYSKVITHNIYKFYEEITIGKGSRDGLKPQDLVINELGLVGIIKEVKKNTSTVELLTNPNTNLSVKINDSYGILTSRDNQIIVQNIKLDQDINIGDKVYTSGLTKTVANIFIGTVKSINTDNLDLEYILEIEALDSLPKLKYVAIISQLKEDES